MILDLVIFEKELYKASCESLNAIKKDLQGERLYSFALTTTGLFGYIFPNANTEEGIIIAAKEVAAKAEGFHNQPETAAKCIRWEPSSYWRFFGKQNDRFEKINDMLDSVNVQDILTRLPSTEFDSTAAKIEESLFAVLNRLRKERHFGQNSDDFYANISYQDQTFEDLHRCALRVNSAELCSKMWNDLSDVLRFWRSKDQEAG